MTNNVNAKYMNFVADYQKARKPETVCRCGRYTFPHRWQPEKCLCAHGVSEYYDGVCPDCRQEQADDAAYDSRNDR
jgi:hypothetical protein